MVEIGKEERIFLPGESLWAKVTKINLKENTFDAELRNSSIHDIPWGTPVVVHRQTMEVVGPKWVLKKAEASVARMRKEGLL